MPLLTESLQAIAGRSGVRSVLVVSADGLPIESAGASIPDPDELAALVSGMVRPAAQLTAAGGIGDTQRIVLESGEGLALLGLVREGHWLVVLCQPDADIGTLLFDLRAQHPSLAAQL